MLGDDRVVVTDKDGNVQNKDDTYKYGDVVKFECNDEGWELVGSVNASCDEDMNFDYHHQDLPQCAGMNNIFWINVS